MQTPGETVKRWLATIVKADPAPAGGDGGWFHPCKHGALSRASAACLALALVSGWGEASQATGEAPAPTRTEGSASTAGIIREGTAVVDGLGSFSVQGERVSFQAQDESLNVMVLENLALERIVRQVTETPKMLLWSVQGTLTEFRGANFLLITRAQLKPTSQRARPEL